MRALRRHTPSLGGQHVVLVLASGLTLPPLTFSAGGVKAFFAALKQVRRAAARGGSAPCFGRLLGPLLHIMQCWMHVLCSCATNAQGNLALRVGVSHCSPKIRHYRA